MKASKNKKELEKEIDFLRKLQQEYKRGFEAGYISGQIKSELIHKYGEFAKKVYLNNE